MDKLKNKAFTLIELMVVVVLIGIIAGFAIPNYDKAIRKAHERDATIQLSSLRAANYVYYAQALEFLDDGGVGIGITAINAGLQINLVSNDLEFKYFREPLDPKQFAAVACYPTCAAANFKVSIDEQAIGPAPLNPCCCDATCPSLGACGGTPLGC